MRIDVEVRGLLELRKKATQMIRDLHGAPILEAMRDSVLLIQRGARINAPVDTGRLRASLTPEVRAEAETVIGVVGSNVVYSAFQEMGTKHMTGRRYLQRAFEDALDRIKARFAKALQEIVNKR